jgi:hypothetical protein
MYDNRAVYSETWYKNVVRKADVSVVEDVPSPEPPVALARSRKNRHLTPGALPTLNLNADIDPSPRAISSPPNSHQDVSRRITCRPTAVDVHRPPRRHPQCLDYLGSRQHREEHRCSGLVKGIRGPHQGHQLG